MPKLKEVRDEIDKIDEEILILLNKRMKIVKNIGILKQNENIHVPQREKDILNNLFLKNNGILKNEDIENIYKNIFEISKKIEFICENNA